MITNEASENASVESIQDSYDQFPYESFAYPQTHPGRLYSIARLFGLNPPDIHNARILEIGGASGGNVIPLALRYPETRIVSLDLSSEQIEEANKSKKALGITNIDFIQRDITKLEEDIGEFDYIICHGVFSWVPDSVRDAILGVCRRHLSESGLAVISYNVLPGWSAIQSLREMMVFHTKDFKTPQQKIQEAKNLLNFLYENTSEANASYRQIIDNERKLLTKTNDSYVFHEHLEKENHQYYLHEFYAMAKSKGLAYVGDTELAAMYLGNFNEKVQTTLSQIKDAVRQEQYIDFLTNRRFRHSILTRKENSPKLNRSLNSAKIAEFHLQSHYKVANEPQTGNTVKYVSLKNSAHHFSSPEPASNAVFKKLAEFNRPVKLADLAAELQRTSNILPDVTMKVMFRNGLNLILRGFVTLHADGISFATSVSDTPKAYVWARHQAKSAAKRTRMVTNLRHETVALSPLLKNLLPHLDGMHTHDQLVEKLVGHALNGEIQVHQDKVRIQDANKLREIMKLQLGQALHHLAQMALLEA